MDYGAGQQSRSSRRISIAELARSGGGPMSSIGSHRTSLGSISGSGGGGGFAQLSRRVTRLIGLQKSLRGSAIREDGGRPGADDFMSRMRPDEAPKVPRFPASLSTEAQYATFKCYERLARSCIMAAGSVAPKELPHTRTPMEMVRTRFELANPQQHQQQQRHEVDDSGSRSQSRLSQATAAVTSATVEIPLPGHSLTAYAPSRQHRRISRDRRETATGQAPSAAALAAAAASGDDAGWPPPRNAQLERQIRLSHRLENVMEIIDHLKSRRGQAVTNQRYQRHQIQPVEHYQMWVRLWNKDFVVRPRGPGEEGALKNLKN